MKYSILRFKPYVELLLFVMTAGLLAYFAQTTSWVWFWITLVVASILSGLLNFLSSDAFKKNLSALRDKEFRLASRFNSVGADDLFLMAVPEQQLERNRRTRQLIETGNRFSLLTISAASYIDPAVDRHWEALKARLDSGCTLRLLVCNPFSPDQETRNTRNGHNRGIDSKLSLLNLLALASQYPLVQIHFIDGTPYAAVFLTEAAATYDPYHLGLVGPRLENRFISLHYSARQGVGSLDHYALLLSHFDFLWGQSFDLSEFLVRYRTKIPTRWGVATSVAADTHLKAVGGRQDG